LNEKIFKNYLELFEYQFILSSNNLKGSNWMYIDCKWIDINVFQMKETKVGSFIESPEWSGRGLINIKNEDDKCFLYCLNYHHLAKTEKKNIERTTVLKKVQKYNFENINFPCNFEDVNYLKIKIKTISINVFFEDSGNIKVAYSSKNKTDDVCNLFLITKDNKNHYCYIKSMSGLRKNSVKDFSDKSICEKCGQDFDKRYQHKCSEEKNVTKIVFNENGSINNFNCSKMLNHPFVCYFDFESSIMNTDDKNKKKHIVNSYAYKIICSFDDKLNSEVKLYRGEDACIKFIDAVCKEQKKIEKCIKNLRSKYNKHNLSDEEEKQFHRSKKLFSMW
jgi:hypothetical protein